MERSDEDLWSAACAGDQAAFTEIFHRYGNSVLTQCVRRAGSTEGSEDMVSNTFLEAWRSRRNVRFLDGSMRPWLLVVAHHVAATHVRTQTRQRSIITRAGHLLSPADDARPDIEASLDAQSLAPLLAAAISGLSRAEQDLVALCDLAGYSPSDAAAVLGLPVGTVKSRRSRAHSKMRASLGPAAAYALGLNVAGEAVSS